MQNQSLLMEDIQVSDEVIFKHLLERHNAFTCHLSKSIHYIVNDYSQGLDANSILKKINDTTNLVSNKHCLLEAKSNLLRYLVNCENNEEIKVVQFLNHLIQSQELKAMKILEKQESHSSFMLVKSTQRTSTISNKLASPKCLFEIRPKYFHSQNENSFSFNSTKEKLIKQLKIKDRELSRLRKIQDNVDEYGRYRSWSLSQQQLEYDKKIADVQQRKSSRELLFQTFDSTSPRQSRLRSVALQRKPDDYKIQIKKLESEIAVLEKQLKTCY